MVVKNGDFPSFCSTIAFNWQFLEIFPDLGQGNGLLERVVHVVERCCQWSDKVLLAEGLSFRGHLVYSQMRQSLSIKEIFAKCLLSILIVPVIILFSLKVILRFILYLKYRGFEEFSKDTILKSSRKRVSLWELYPGEPLCEYAYAVNEADAINLSIPFDSYTKRSILFIHSLVRSGDSISQLEKKGFIIHNKSQCSQDHFLDEEVVFSHPSLPHYRFYSVVSQQLKDVFISAMDVAKARTAASHDAERSRMLLRQGSMSPQEKDAFFKFCTCYCKAPVKGALKGKYALIIEEAPLWSTKEEQA